MVAVPFLLIRFNRHMDEVLACLDNCMLCGVDFKDVIELLPRLELQQKTPLAKVNILNFLQKLIVNADGKLLARMSDQLMQYVMKAV